MYHSDLKDKLVKRLHILAEYHSSAAERETSRSSKDNFEKGKEKERGEGELETQSNEQDIRQRVKRRLSTTINHNRLSSLFHAMSLWMKESRYGPALLLDKAHSLDNSFCPGKLISLYTDFPIKGNYPLKPEKKPL